MNKRLITLASITVIIFGTIFNPMISYASSKTTEAATEKEAKTQDLDELQDSGENKDDIDTGDSTDSIDSTGSTDSIDNNTENVPDSTKQSGDAISEAKNGVVQINCVYVDDDNNVHIFKGASGILIGEAEGDEYVLTSLARMVPTEEEKNAFLVSVGVGADELDRVKLSYKVVIENDMSAEATMLNSSADLDLAVFKLGQALYNRTPMSFLYSSKNSGEAYDKIDTAYALGFPDAIEHGVNEAYYSNDRVNKMAGQISNVIPQGDSQWIEHRAEIGDNNAGGPLITPDGEVIGMNSLKLDGNYSYALSSNTIVKVLSGMGVTYTGVTFEDKEKKEAEEQKAKEKDKDEPVIKVEQKTPKWVLPVFIVLGVLLIGALTTIIVLLVLGNKKKKSEDNQRDIEISGGAALNYQFQPTIPADFASAGVSSDTTVLGAGSAPVNTMAGTNMAAPSQQLNGGNLERKKNNENIAITKSSFRLGKDDLHCDYCVRDNNTISRQHAVITTIGNNVYIEDNNSKNGTFLNGIMLVAGQRQELRNGDIIKLSNEEFVYKK